MLLWNAQAEDGKRNARWDGSGKENDWRKKNIRERCEENERDN